MIWYCYVIGFYGSTWDLNLNVRFEKVYQTVVGINRNFFNLLIVKCWNSVQFSKDSHYICLMILSDEATF